MSAPLSSLEKKRLRDRRAQNARRARKDAYTQQLELMVERCRRDHGQHEDSIRTLRSALETLSLENAELRRRQAAVADLLAPGRPLTASTSSASAAQQDALDSHGDHCSWDKASECTHKVDTAISGRDDWQRPPNNTSYDAMVETLTPWMMCPAVASTLSDVPYAPDFLYGTRENPLANAIHIATTCAYYGNLTDAVRLALGWSLYVYTKWLFDPTLERFERLPVFLRPTELQRSRAHSALIDIIVWPQIRDNLIMTCSTMEDLHHALRSISPQLVIVWPEDAPLMEPQSGQPDHLVIHKDFFDKFMNLDSWTVSADFPETFPVLTQGIVWSPADSSAHSSVDPDSAGKRLKYVKSTML